MSKIKSSELMVYLFFIIITFCKGIGLSNSSNLYLMAYIFGIMLLLLKIWIDKFTKKEFLTIVTILTIGVIDFYLKKETTVLFTAIALACMKNIKIDKVIKIMFWVRLISFLLIIALSLSGIIENNVFSIYRATKGELLNRYAFGYGHPNLAHSSFAIIIILFGYCYYNKINIFTIGICEILNILLYKFTLSRTGFVLITIFLIFIYATKKVKFINRNISKMLNISLIAFILITFIFAIGYGKYPIFSQINELLTGRIHFLHKVLYNYKIPLFSYNNYEGVLFDNGYFDLIYNGGLIASIWFFYNQFKTNKILKERNIIRECVITIFFLFYSITESYYASILMNPCLLFFGYNIFNSNLNKVSDKNIKNDIYVKDNKLNI